MCLFFFSTHTEEFNFDSVSDLFVSMPSTCYPDHDAARKGELNQQSWQNLNIRS